jgi:DNA helicase-2/ATP-dependent DNA helicase PcrA
MSRIEVNTYHGFAWRLLRSHLYLLNGKRGVRLLTPPDAAAHFSGMSDAERDAERSRLYAQEGRIDFDQFARLAGDLLQSSEALRRLISGAYPVLVLDEFQDTDALEWRLISLLGERSRLLALADPNQRIYEFRGADPARIEQYVAAFQPTIIDFGSANFRSDGTDITTYGNDLLSGAHRTKRYRCVTVIQYKLVKAAGPHYVLKSHVLGARDRLCRNNDNSKWSVAILVPTKRMMIDVSDYLSNEQVFSSGRNYPSIDHDVAVDAEGPTLAAAVIAALLDQSLAGKEGEVATVPEPSTRLLLLSSFGILACLFRVHVYSPTR